MARNQSGLQRSASDKGTRHVSSFDLPLSDLLGESTHSHLRQKVDEAVVNASAYMAGPSLSDVPLDQVPDVRQQQAESFYKTPLYRRMTERYSVNVSTKTIGGVLTEVFLPDAGIDVSNQDRVLINLHGGSFCSGSRTATHLESIPISSVGQIKVISVDYRMAPEYRYPAATEDVLAVYQALLEDYEPRNIGLYGASAGALLSAQVIAALVRQSLPLPSAVAMIGASALGWDRGDSRYFAENIRSQTSLQSSDASSLYLSSCDSFDANVFPGNDPDVLAQFPPSLLLSATRDDALSVVVHNHSQFVKLGVKSELYVWEGLGHTFHYDSAFSASRDVYQLLVNYFNRHFGLQKSTE